ncbi:immunoglobulin-like domain-containing protein [Listeria grandensis]|uniref:immunoglobulin-like domain-containing protein n=1 Tax=Listeria grandensis TaxID=1494963 RepID=UPI00164D5AEA|nr:immunoglobulin-like domain-containing protein [Listeria grandensis]MBC6315904.1 hypothetical protein [Listeria grandensis]
MRANMQAAIVQAKDLLKVRNTPLDYNLLADDADITSATITGTVGKGITSVRLLIDDVVKANGTLNADGTYSIPTNDFITQGSKVEVAGYNGTNEVARKTVKVSNNERPLAPGANEALAKTMAVNAVMALFQDNNLTSNVLSPMTAQNMINVVQTLAVRDSLQQELDKAQNLLNATQAPANFSLTLAPYKLGKGNYVTGQFSGDIAKISLTVKNVEGSKISVSGSDFKYYASNVIYNQIDLVILTAYDINGKVLVTKTVTVTKDEPVLSTGIINSVTPFQIGTESYVTGTFTGDIVKVELQIHEKPLQRISVTGGTIKYYVKPNITKTTDSVDLVGYNAAGEAVSSKKVTFATTGTGTTNGDVTVDSFSLGKDGYVKGQFTGDVAKIS